jgi:hypothetical protein
VPGRGQTSRQRPSPPSPVPGRHGVNSWFRASVSVLGFQPA